MKGAKILLAVSAVLAIGAGAAMIFATAAFLGPQGISVDDKVALLGQAQGALLVGIGVLNLLAMRCSDAKGLQAVLGGNLALQITGLGVNIRARRKLGDPPGLWGRGASRDSRRPLRLLLRPGRQGARRGLSSRISL